MRSRSTPLGNQLLLAFAAVSLLSLLPIVSIFIWQTQNTLTEQTGQTFASLAGSNSQRLSVDLGTELVLLQNLSQTELFLTRISQTSERELGSLSTAEREALLAEREASWQAGDNTILENFVLVNAASSQLNTFATRFPQHTELLMTDRFGSAVATSGYLPEKYIYADEAWWQKLWANRFVTQVQVGDVVLDTAANQTLVNLEFIFQAPNTTAFRGILRSRLRLAQLRTLADVSLPGETGELMVIDGTGLVIYATDSARVGSTLLLLTEPWTAVTDTDGRAVIRGQSPVQPTVAGLPTDSFNWYIIIQQDAAEALATVSQLTRLSVVGALLALGLAMVVGYQITRQLVRPIENLTQTAVAIAAGDLRRTAERLGPQELQTLAEAFNSTTSQLRQTLESLEHRVGERTAELAQRVDQLNLLNQVGQEIISLLDTAVLLPRITTLLRESFDYYAVILFLLDDERQTLNIGASAPAGLPLQLRVGQGIVGRVARIAQPLVVNNVARDPYYQFEESLPDTQAELALPLRVGEKLLGVLDLQSARYDVFTADTVTLFTTLADQIAIAIYNAQLFESASAAQKEAERANQIKSQFLANMSHELRTPLNAIINFTGFVADGLLGEVNEEQVDSLGKVLTSSDHLLSLINDVLDLSKIETGQMSLFLQEVDLNAILGSVSSTAKGLIKDKPLELELEIEGKLPLIQGDKRRIRQILLNLISNAVKFTLEGTIAIRAYHTAEGIHMAVRDTGIGIAPEDQEMIFESFRQAQHDLYNVSGTGLGLPITKHFVEAHGGRIWLESTLGAGSTFYVTLPLNDSKK